MAKKSILSRLFFRNGKKSLTATNVEQVKSTSFDTSSSKNKPSCAVSTKSSCSKNKSSTKKEQMTDTILKVSKQKQQQLLSLLKYSYSNTDDISDDFLALKEMPSQQQSLYLLRLYLATVQKLKRYQPNSMEKQKAVYNLLSSLVIQQELDRFDSEFEPVGRKPRKTRYISTLLDTPVESIQPFHHPVVEATKRKPFVETCHVVIPESSSSSSPSSSAFSSSTISLASTSTSSSSTLTSSSAASISSSPATFFHSSSSFSPYKQNRNDWFLFHLSSSPPILPRASSFIITPPPSPSNINTKQNQVAQLWTSRSDPHLHSSFVYQSDLQQQQHNGLDTTTKHSTPLAAVTTATTTEDEDDIPLAVLRTRKSDRALELQSVQFCC
ncbi:hypothetical protein BCR42DRAFT_416255 [Absidia repens]|uniref:Uncharacterized protein n=1 Tax=Absidia repens TaxID=90262 RepID=A0A1X2IE96_9FUNG|nr:hypothetical protein BCR42DRAFT_416255 [Absidia repens]